jgi:hypothetical protein
MQKYFKDDMATYPIFYCNRCGVKFMYNGSAIYPHCVRCNSTTGLKAYDRTSAEKNFNKLLCACSNCRHIWLMKSDKMDKQTHCPICKFHSSGRRFFWYFINEYKHKLNEEQMADLLKKKFPFKRDFVFRRYDADGDWIEHTVW